MFIAIQRIVIRPLRLLEDSAGHIREGDYNFRIRVNKKDEIGRLAVAFEAMRRRIRSTDHQLRTSEKKYRSLIEHAFEAVAIARADGDIIDCSSKLSDLSGYSIDELRNDNFFRLIEYDKRSDMPIGRAERQSAEHFETILNSKFDQHIPVEIYLIKGFSLDADKNLSFVYVRDISERKKVEQSALQTEKMYTLGHLSAGIAHEIRNPLFALNNNLDYLHTKYQGSQPFSEVYPEVRSSISRIENIISSILDFARPHPPTFKSVHIQDIIEGSISLVRKQFEKSAIQIETVYGHDPRPLQGDQHRLEQVLVNLFLNAFQAMPGAGKLSISTSSKKEVLELKICDTGKGIPAEEIDRIFYPFYTRTPGGTGLGLAIVQLIVEQHQGQIAVTSEIGMGTSFYIQLPYQRSS